MTIQELIDKLTTLNPGAEILSEDFGGEPTEIFSVKVLDNGDAVLLLS